MRNTYVNVSYIKLNMPGLHFSLSGDHTQYIKVTQMTNLVVTAVILCSIPESRSGDCPTEAVELTSKPAVVNSIFNLCVQLL